MRFKFSSYHALLILGFIALSITMSAYAASNACEKTYDTFQTSALDTTKWSLINASSFLHPGNGNLTIAKASGGNSTASLTALKAAKSDCVETSMAMDSASLFAKGRVRLRGVFYNQQFKDIYRASLGEVRGEIAIENRFGELRVIATAVVASGINFSDAKNIFTHEFDTVPKLKSIYHASIALDKTNQQLIFGFNNELYIHFINTPIYPSNPQKASKQLQVNTVGGVGQTVGKFYDFSYNPYANQNITSLIKLLLFEKKNSVPVLTDPGNQSNQVNETVSLALTATDADGDTLSYSASGLPTGLNINSSTGVISGIPTTANSFSVTVTANDGSVSVNKNFVWTIQANNQLPVLTNPGNQSNQVDETVSLALTASDADGDTLSYSASGLPTGLNINSSTGVISGIPTAANSFNVTVTVNDGSDSVNQNFIWTIQAVNEIPVLIDPSDQVTAIGQLVTLQLMASDADGDTLTFSNSPNFDLPGGLNIDSSTGLISGTPTTEGVFEVIVCVSDGLDKKCRTFFWTITP